MALSSQQKNTEKFKNNLRARMARLNLQANEVAERIGVTPAAVSNWLASGPPKGSNMRRLAEVLQCDPDWLVGLKDEPYPTSTPSPMVLRETAASAELEQWRQRALAAESQLESLRAGLRALVEASEGHGPAPAPPRTVIEHKKHRAPTTASSDPVSKLAREGALLAGREAGIEPRSPEQKPEAGEHSGQSGETK